MAQKGIVFSTTLGLTDCANIFRDAASNARGINARLTEAAAKMRGNGELTGFYTPTFDSPFTAIEGVPDFAVGLNFLGPMRGANGPGIPVHMYIDDGGEDRKVEIVATHGLAGGPRASRLARKVFEGFLAVDPGLSVHDTNIQLTTQSSQESADPDLAAFDRAVQASRAGPPPGDEGEGMGAPEIAAIFEWMNEAIANEEYLDIWEKRLALGYPLSGEDAHPEHWFWVNAWPAQSAIQLGLAAHPFAAVCGAYADDAYRSHSEPTSAQREAHEQIIKHLVRD